MTDDSKTELPAQLWAPWVTDRSTLHLVHDAPEGHDIRYRGEAAARPVEDPDGADCAYDGGSSFHRTLCPKP